LSRTATVRYSPAVSAFHCTVLFLVLLAAPAWAQAPVEEQPHGPPPADSCALGRISYVFIDNQSVFDTSDPTLDSRFRWAYRAANALHWRTREWVIRRELLFEPGSCYDPFLLEETERLLRNYDFLSRVDIFAVPLPDQTFHVIVGTRDEWSTRVDVRITGKDGFAIEGVRISEDNLFGTGQSVGAWYLERDITREYGVTYHTPQLLSTRWDLSAALGRTRAGTLASQEIAYPFVGEIGRWAGRQSFLREDQYFDYITADDPGRRAPHVLVPTREQSFDLSVVRRVGRRGNMALLGTALTYQQLTYPGVAEVAPEGEFSLREPAPDSLADRVRVQRGELHNIRAFALLGHRNVWWVRRRGLDSMRGQEDVRLGAEAILGIGKSLPSIESDDDLYGMLTLYTGFEMGDLLVVGRARADARRNLSAVADAEEWEDVYGEVEVLTYLQSPLLPRHTVVLRAAALGGWHTRTPFQLTLGGVHGLRGYDVQRLPGGRRAVLTVEDRFYLGWPLPAMLDMGGTVFVDAGRMWAGDAPFGADSGWRGAAGAGLRASFPAGSRSTYRVDFAWPLERGTSLGDVRVSLTIGELRGILPRDHDPRLVRSRTSGVGGDMFTFRQ
jgi:hypothetical protein